MNIQNNFMIRRPNLFTLFAFNNFKFDLKSFEKHQLKLNKIRRHQKQIEALQSHVQDEVVHDDVTQKFVFQNNIVQNNNAVQENIVQEDAQDDTSTVKSTPYYNAIGIQMIPNELHSKIFRDKRECLIDKRKIKEVTRHLNHHGLKSKRKNIKIPDIEKYLPDLIGQNLDEHYFNLGKQYSEKYRQLSYDIINFEIPPIPSDWERKVGWTRYSKQDDGTFKIEPVDYPLEDILVFDVEVCMNDSNGKIPTLATALSTKAWYSWCSQRLLNHDSSLYFTQLGFNPKVSLNYLIPMGQSFDREKLIIGHNVSFDRSFIKEQYFIDADKTRFMDTLSLHMCISGLTQHQRALSYSQKIRGSELEDESIVSESDDEISAQLWSGIGSLNNLVDVHQLYCSGQKQISKDPRKVFEKGTLKDVNENFQDLMTYCANDVIATLEIFQKIFPIYEQRFPNPVTLAGQLELSTMYLPVVMNNWQRYVSEAQTIYDDQERELNLSLREIANQACTLLNEKQFTKDIWLWDLDWDTPKIRFKKSDEVPKKKFMLNTKEEKEENTNMKTNENSLLTKNVLKTLSTSSLLRKIQPLLPGYPRWYAEFCSKPFEDDLKRKKEWEPGPYLISTQMRSVPKLMRLMWNGYPLHYDAKHGWGYLKPDPQYQNDVDEVPGGIDSIKNTIYFSLKELKRIVNEMKESGLVKSEDDLMLSELQEQTKPSRNVVEGCLFYKLPHRGGPSKRVGNPLGKDFLKKVEDGTLTSYKSDITSLVLNQSKILSYWKNACKRIQAQLVICSNSNENGAILPRVIVSGTVTRRAVEPTWLTASNAYEDRLGSELKGMIQCPDDYSFVGADVDSQELWIASLLGDSAFAGMHGCTGIGWMTLQGSKTNSTDMHSKTAQSINISRDQAKILNYARIYGSGQPFATRFLMQSNLGLTEKEAKEKAKKIFTETKGIRRKLVSDIKENHTEINMIDNQNNKFVKKNVKMQWVNGTESNMFNKLEEIATSPEPRTPVLGCRISRALEPQVVHDNYITSRINWVVQSSAVDFLHLMLVTMKWLMDENKINGRFSISIHDEVRYLIKNEHKYQAAMALQLSNLLTRSFFSYKLGMNDLPLSVAFFSSVDIDKCLRKEVNLDCKTPSNPLGLKLGYGIPFGESLDIFQLIKKLNKKHNE